MKISPKLLSKYNKMEATIIVSSFPAHHGESAKQNAVANYTRELARSMAVKSPVIVICEILNKPEMYVEDGILVVRAYRKNSKKIIFDLAQTIAQFTLVREVLIQFEFNIFGGVIATSTIMGLFPILRLLGKKSFIMFHQVVDNLDELSTHLGMEGKTLKRHFFNFGMQNFYRVIGSLTDYCFVHNKFLKYRLSQYINKDKIAVIAHGVTFPKQKTSYSNARKSLGIKEDVFVLLSFGYLAWYKGSDWVAKQVIEFAKTHPHKKVKLILAGGPSVTMADRDFYQKYLSHLTALAREHSKLIEITGYVPDQQVQKYFVASDAVVLPYRVAMSESGPFSHALAYGKPVIMSEARAISILDELDTLLRSLIFKLKKEDFQKKLLFAINNPKKLAKVAATYQVIAQNRTWNNIASEYLTIMKTPSERTVPRMSASDFAFEELR